MAGPFEIGGGALGGLFGGRAGAVGGGITGGALGGLAGGGAGTLVEPGGGTIVGGILGEQAGQAAGTAIGGAVGSRVGRAVGSGVGRWIDKGLGYGDQGTCGGQCMSADKAPGKPEEKDGYTPPKRWDGKKVASPGGYGWPDQNGNVWVPTGPDGSPAAHGGEHWDVQSPGGGYTNVYPGGIIRGGKAPFPKF